jgi:hypothetical protein
MAVNALRRRGELAPFNSKHFLAPEGLEGPVLKVPGQFFRASPAPFHFPHNHPVVILPKLIQRGDFIWCRDRPQLGQRRLQRGHALKEADPAKHEAEYDPARLVFEHFHGV